MTYFFDKLSKAVPEWMLVVMLLVLSIMAIIIFSRKGVLRIQLRRLLKVMFVEYIILLFCSTVVFREDFGHTGVRYTLFEKYLDNNMYLLKDALLNIAIFIPVGFCSSVFYIPKDTIAVRCSLLHDRAIPVYPRQRLVRCE